MGGDRRPHPPHQRCHRARPGAVHGAGLRVGHARPTRPPRVGHRCPRHGRRRPAGGRPVRADRTPAPRHPAGRDGGDARGGGEPREDPLPLRAALPVRRRVPARRAPARRLCRPRRRARAGRHRPGRRRGHLAGGSRAGAAAAGTAGPAARGAPLGALGPHRRRDRGRGRRAAGGRVQRRTQRAAGGVRPGRGRLGHLQPERELPAQRLPGRLPLQHARRPDGPTRGVRPGRRQGGAAAL